MLGILCGVCGPAHAQSAPEDPCLRSPQCQELLARAQAASQAQQYDVALRSYRSAHALSAANWLLVNIGRIHHKLGHYTEAKKFYLRYLATPRQLGDDEQRSAAIEFLRQADGQLAVPQEAPTPVSPPVAAPVAIEQPAIPVAPAARPVYKKWWFWTLTFGLTAAAATGVALAVALQPMAPPLPMAPPGVTVIERTF